ncbi:hypothetical protein KTS45_10435 [Halomicroarcula limicola]|uniref:DUF7305 domain-containing protein n=1 Tax=Haloarcula limicola TaxID=1429915 RepID=A0A8J8C4W5_9EURY|nr:hypothetical protein [Halomicroarcula limicola]MBV0924614.1 hypothetical protein [Halomicroarcula limicola]
MHRGSGTTGARRGQTGPLGLVLVFALVIASTTALVAFGATAITDTQDRLDSERMEKTMTQLDSQAALVALGDSEVQQVDISVPGRQGYLVDSDAGQLTLSYENTTTGAQRTVFSTEMGAVVYELSDGSTVAYQGGGVWRSDDGRNSVMISPPEFHYREATLTLPLVTVDGDERVDGRAVITHNNSTRYYPNERIDSAFTNPMENGKVQVTVTSTYYRAWGQYFETRTDGTVQYDHANDRVTLTLVTPLQNTRITSATASLSASGSFQINGGTNTQCSPSVYTNSYNSSGTTDGYCAQTPGHAGDIVYGGDVDISNGAGGDDIRGDVVSGGTVYVGNGGGKPYVYGNISYTDNCERSLAHCRDRITYGGGSLKQISGIEEAPAVNGVIRTRVEEVAADNDNGTTGNVTAGEVDFGNAGATDTAELDAGVYYLDELTVPSDNEVVLDTTGGDVVLVVEENVYLHDQAKITVVGDGKASVYVGGAGTDGSGRHFYMGSNSAVTNAGDDAPQFRMYGKDNFTAQLGSGSGGNLAKYVGVIYAPPGNAGTGSVTLDGGEIFGGVLTGTTTIDGGNGGSIHYDEALRTERVLERSDSVVKVTYIHASVNEVNVTSA